MHNAAAMEQQLVTKSQNGVRHWGMTTSFLLWTLIGLLSDAHNLAHTEGRTVHQDFWPGLLISLACAYIWALLSSVIFSVQRRFRFTERPYLRNLVVLSATGLILSYASSRLTYIASLVVDHFFGSRSARGTLLRVEPSDLFLEFLVYWSIVGTGFVLQSFVRLHEQERRVARLALEKSQLESTLKESELEQMRMRLNPHFLFNALQNIAALTRQQPKTASRMLVQLASLMRAAFRGDGQQERSLFEELEFLNAYIELEKMRFGDRLKVRLDIDERTLDAVVPAFLLQPLVENAIQHGLGSLPGLGVIEIRTSIREDQLVLWVADNGMGLPGGGLEDLELGVGLGSTLERLTRMYPEREVLTLSSGSEKGTEVQIKLPLRLHVEVGVRKGLVVASHSSSRV